MHAGLVTRQRTLREIYTAMEVVRLFVVVGAVVVLRRNRGGGQLRIAA